MGRRVREITLQVDVMVDDVLDQINDDELVAELGSRNVGRTHLRAVENAIAQIRRGDALDAITTLEREFWPKWASAPDSEAAFRKAANDNQEAALSGAAA